MKLGFRRWTWCSFGIITSNCGASVRKSRVENIQKDNLNLAFEYLVSIKG